MNFLITGTSSGLGAFFYNQFIADKYIRKPKFQEDLKNQYYDVIIHTAFNRNNDVKVNSYKEYLNDTIFLTKKLTNLTCKKFIYISSIDVYPKNIDIAKEDADFLINNIESLYGRTKLLSEYIVQEKCQNFLILRLSAILGANSRKNSLIKLLSEVGNINLTLSANSSFNYILYTDVLEFIKASISKDIKGTFNLAADTNITLQEVADIFNIKDINFGNFCYTTPKICNLKAKNINSIFSRKSLENINIFKNNFLKNI